MGSHGDDCTCEECERIAEQMLVSSGRWKKCKGYAIKTLEMNPEEYDEIYFEGDTLLAAIGDYVREAEYWSYEPSNEEVIYEDIWDAVEYELDIIEQRLEDEKEGVR